MNEPQHLVNYIYLGYHLERLYFTYDRQYSDVVEGVRKFIDLAKHLTFLPVAAQMSIFLVDLEKAHEETPEAFKEQRFGLSSYGEHLPSDYGNRLSQIVTDFMESLKNEGRNWEVVQIDRSMISDVLRGLRSHATDQHQGTLIDEAIRCLECGAYRAAIVTGWNLALDHFRQWIFSSPRKRLKELNVVLTNNNRKPPQVVHYEDFFELPERVLIDDAHAAKAASRKYFQEFPYNVSRNLRTQLRGFRHGRRYGVSVPVPSLPR